MRLYSDDLPRLNRFESGSYGRNKGEKIAEPVTRGDQYDYAERVRSRPPP
jgi:hypothetical protein